MKTYLEEALKFIESEEMREYLRTNLELVWGDHIGEKCAEIVAYAPAPLEEKIPVLELIAEQAKYDKEDKYNNPAVFAKSARAALDERYKNNPHGTVFTLTLYYQHGNHKLTLPHANFIFMDFDSAMRELQDCNDNYNLGETWLEIEKWIPYENGKLESYFWWILNSAGEIWYSGYGFVHCFSDNFDPENWADLYDHLGGLNLPVPFQPRDIILADCRPFAEERCVLIIDTGDNRDCCSLICLYIEHDGKVAIGAFKHHTFLSQYNEEVSCLSALYRAKRWDGKLPKHEAPLAVIGAAIKDNPALRKQIEDYLHDCATLAYKKNRDMTGVKWKILKEKFDL